MLYTEGMDRKRSEQVESPAPLRLRIPAALAVVVFGGAASVAMSFASCDVEPVPPEPTDAGDRLTKEFDGGIDSNDDDDDVVETSDAPRDAYVPPDTPVG